MTDQWQDSEQAAVALVSLLHRLALLEVTLVVDGDRVRAIAVDVIPQEIAEQIGEREDELRDLLRVSTPLPWAGDSDLDAMMDASHVYQESLQTSAALGLSTERGSPAWLLASAGALAVESGTYERGFRTGAA